MRGVSRRVANVEDVSARRDPIVFAEDVQVLLRYWNHLTPESRHALNSPQLIRAVHQFRRIDDVRRALLMYVDANLRVLTHEQACCPGMIEMNVRDENRLDIADPDALRL